MTPDELIKQLGPSSRNWADTFSEQYEVTARPEVPLFGRDPNEAMVEWFQGAIEAGIRATNASYEVRPPWRWLNSAFYVAAAIATIGVIVMIWVGDWFCGVPFAILAVNAAWYPTLWETWYRVGYRHGWDRVPTWKPERKAAR